MKELSLRQRLINYLKKKGDWVASGHLQELAQQSGYWSPQNTGRRLRELENEGILEVNYRKGHAWYRFNQRKVEPRVAIRELNGHLFAHV